METVEKGLNYIFLSACSNIWRYYFTQHPPPSSYLITHNHKKVKVISRLITVSTLARKIQNLLGCWQFLNKVKLNRRETEKSEIERENNSPKHSQQVTFHFFTLAEYGTKKAGPVSASTYIL